MKCKKCKKDIPDESLYCLFCGAPQKKNPKKKMYQRPDGLFEKIITINGKRVPFRGKTEAEVIHKIAEHNQQQERGRSFLVVAEEWKEEHFKTLEYNSTRNYIPAYKRAIEQFGAQYIKEITPNMVNSFIGQFARGGRAQKTVQTQLLILNLIFSRAIVNGDIDTNPAAYVRVPKNLSKSSRMPPTEAQIDVVKNSLDKPFGLLPFFMLYTGCRLGEALALQFQDIDFDNNRIIINKSVYFEGNAPKIKSPKTIAGTREIILLNKLKAVVPKGPKCKFVFFGGEKPMTSSQFRLGWNTYCRAVGLATKKEDRSGKAYYVPQITPHQLRHAYATILFEAGINEKDAQELLGHANISVTRDIYTHIRNSRKEETARVLNDYSN